MDPDHIIKGNKNIPLIGMTKLQAHLDFLDEEQATEITDKGPLFETDSSFVRVNNIIVITYIAHKLCAEYLWQ